MEWIVVTVIVALVGLFMTVGKPIIKLNSNLVTLNVNIETLREEMAEQKRELRTQKTHAHESHQKLWNKNNEQDKRIDDHEVRIKLLENDNKDV